MTQTVRAMQKILKDVPGAAELIMENSAGGGQKIGASITEIGELRRRVASPRVKVCLDTAHAFEAGIIGAYTPKNLKELFDTFDRLIGLDHLAVIHANDSKTVYNSHHDQHENIGEGHIGRQGFLALGKEKRLIHVPFILEVPGFTGEGPDKKNVNRLRSLLL